MNGIKIIVNVLDDEEAILIGVEDILSDNTDLKIECFNKVDTFFEKIDTNTDLVITDVRLNQGYDIEVIIERINEKNPNCYIIVMSAYMDLKLAEHLSMLGIRWVQKDNVDWLDKLKKVVDIIYPSLKIRAKSKHLFK